MPKRAVRETAPWSAVVPSREDQFRLKRLALIREAGKAFGRRGFHNTSLDDVARALKVTKPALYYYVKTKEEILFECHNYALDLGERARDLAFAEASTAGERLRILLTRYIEFITSEFGAYAVLAEPINSLSDEHRAHIIGRRRAFDRLFRGLVTDAIREGAIAPCEPKLAVAFFMAAINGINRWFSPTGEHSGGQVATAFVGFIFEGLRGSPAAAGPPGEKPKASRRAGRAG